MDYQKYIQEYITELKVYVTNYYATIDSTKRMFYGSIFAIDEQQIEFYKFLFQKTNLLFSKFYSIIEDLLKENHYQIINKWKEDDHNTHNSCVCGNFSFYVLKNDKYYYFEFTQFLSMGSIFEKSILQKKYKIDPMTNINFIIDENKDCESRFNLYSHNIDLYLKCKYPNVNKVAYCIEDYIKEYFGTKEWNLFLKAIIDYKNSIHNIFGFQIVQLCNKENKDRLKNKLLDYFLDDKSYIDLKNINESQGLFSELNKDIYTNIFESFKNNKYKIILGERDFADQFITSEWLFNNSKNNKFLDYTYMVVGYLKSIETLLFNIFYYKGYGYTIKNGNDGLTTLTDENLESIDKQFSVDKTLGSLFGFLEYHIKKNSHIYVEREILGNKQYVLEYILNNLNAWRKSKRNGFLHSHNISEYSQVEIIRNSTIYLYVLILGCIQLSDYDINKLATI